MTAPRWPSSSQVIRVAAIVGAVPAYARRRPVLARNRDPANSVPCRVRPHPGVWGLGSATTASALAAAPASLCLCHACNRQLGHPADDSPGNTGRGRSTPGEEHRRGTGLPSSRRRTGVSPPSRRRLIPLQRDNADSDEPRARHPAVEHSATPGGGWRLPLGASTSDELLGAAEIRTPALLGSARARGIGATRGGDLGAGGWGCACAFTRKHSRGRLDVDSAGAYATLACGRGWQHSPSVALRSFRRTIRGASMCPDSGSVEQCPEHPRRRSLVTAGKRGQPPARDAGPDLEPNATVLLCRVDPEAASASSGRFVAAPGRRGRRVNAWA